jgi:hypothetical protein
MTLRNGSNQWARIVRVADLRSYLLGKGWQVDPFKRPQVILFQGRLDDAGNPLKLLVPASEDLDDYPLRIEETLQTLGLLENRPIDEIVRNIVTPTSDILHLRLECPETRTGTLALGLVEPFFANVRNLLVFAACGEIRPQPYYTLPLKQAVQLANRCRLRPAPTASFRVDVEVSVAPPVNQAQIQSKAYPLERRVLLSLMQALGQLQRSFEEGQPGRVVTASASRVSANLSEAILGMRSGLADARWEASVSWSASWPLDEHPPERIVFEGRAFEQLDSISRALRTGDGPSRRQFRGRVVRLTAADSLHSDAGPLTITLAVDSARAPAHVQVILNPAQYREACIAHLEGQPILIKGVLDRVGRTWQLVDVSDFRVLNEAVP